MQDALRLLAVIEAGDVPALPMPSLPGWAPAWLGAATTQRDRSWLAMGENSRASLVTTRLTSCIVVGPLQPVLLHDAVQLLLEGRPDVGEPTISFLDFIRTSNGLQA